MSRSSGTCDSRSSSFRVGGVVPSCACWKCAIEEDREDRLALRRPSNENLRPAIIGRLEQVIQLPETSFLSLDGSAWTDYPSTNIQAGCIVLCPSVLSRYGLNVRVALAGCAPLVCMWAATSGFILS